MPVSSIAASPPLRLWLLNDHDKDTAYHHYWSMMICVHIYTNIASHHKLFDYVIVLFFLWSRLCSLAHINPIHYYVSLLLLHYTTLWFSSLPWFPLMFLARHRSASAWLKTLRHATAALKPSAMVLQLLALSGEEIQVPHWRRKRLVKDAEGSRC